ncbi:hypothetical protein HMPREF0277_0934, partial [Corynebacterium accolens ATCC 49726]
TSFFTAGKCAVVVGEMRVADSREAAISARARAPCRPVIMMMSWPAVLISSRSTCTVVAAESGRANCGAPFPVSLARASNNPITLKSSRAAR